MILLDTDIVVAHLRGNPGVTGKIVEKVTEIGLPVLALAELEYGALISGRPQANLKNLRSFVSTITVVPFDSQCAVKYGEIKARLKSIGGLVGEADILIAALTLAQDALLITHNYKHFEMIKGLKLEDWLA